MKGRGAIFIWLMAIVFCCLVCGCHSVRNQKNSLACDSLCDLSYQWVYKNLDSAWSYAKKAESLAKGNTENQVQVLNHLALIQFMRMDFVGSRNLYRQAYSLSNNILYQLVSEIGLMRVSQRTSENADFYMYRNSAQRHITRIQEEKDELNEHEQHIFQLSVQDFHTISAQYFLNLQQTYRAATEIEAFIPDENLMKADTAQWLSINYLRGTYKFVSGNNYLEKNLNSFDALMYGLRISRENKYNYFTSKYLQGLSVLLNRHNVIKEIKKERTLGLQILNENDVPLSLLSEELAKEALRIAETYKDIYLISVSWRVLAGCYFRQGQYEQSLAALDCALNEVNNHYKTHYKHIKTPHLLEPFNPTDSISVEKKWMSDSHILTVPEWIARIREQYSLVYSALGDKMRSDYNRNIYLDILDVTRQDKETEMRYHELQQESRQLNILLFVVVITILCASSFLYYFNSKWRLSHQRRILKLRKTLDFCRHLTADMSDDVSDETQLLHQLSVSLKRQMTDLFGSLEILREGNADIKVVANGDLSKDEKIMLDVISCFMNWAFSQGRNIVILGERFIEIQEEKAVLEQRIQKNKQENEIRRACISLVNNATPFIDRILHELLRLKTDNAVKERTVRYQYICELVDKINDYNNLLTHWIQIRRGMFNLHIETFPLMDLFTIIAQRKHWFEREGKSLIIHPTNTIVKADRLLTLFMLNTLVENAFKYSMKGDKAIVYAEEADGFVEISIQDTGIGLSQADCERILQSKIYDPSLIGMSTDNADNILKQKKGFGFGLMNCKSIIEKYRKTNPLFKVCLFGIDSVLGKGSRFFFRLPKGTVKFLLLFVSLSSLLVSCRNSSSSQVVWKPADSLLTRASVFADSVYYCNIDARYNSALQFADSARNCLNAYYLKVNHGGKELMQVYSENDPVELNWLNNNFNTDYHVILDIRNESAIAALALKKWNIYKYNNTAYTSLFKLLGEDHRLGDYCKKMQRSATNKIVLIVIFLLFSISFGIAYYILYFRRQTMFIINLKQLLMMNKNLLNTVVGGEPDSLAHILKMLRRDLVEIAPVRDLSAIVYNENTKNLDFFSTGICHDKEQLYHNLERAFKTEEPLILQKGCEFIIPLAVEWGTSRQCIGAWHVLFAKEDANDSLELLFTLLSGSFANYLFHTIVRIGRKKRDLELAEDENRRFYNESYRLYVQNQVLDNCLSTIKHETMFYPNRIRQLAVLVGKENNKIEQTSISDMYELAAYYKKIYSLLTLNAERQLAESVFKCTNVNVMNILDSVQREYCRMIKKSDSNLALDVQHPDNNAWYVKGDELLLNFLLHNILVAAFRHPSDGRLTLSFNSRNGMIRFIIEDDRTFFRECDLRLLFSPEGCHLTPSDKVEIGTEYLICKQIVRDHATYTGNHGCRINAELLEKGGYMIWFTIPESQTIYNYGTI